MVELSFSALLIRFLLGGSAVVACTIVGKKLGERAGGIFAAFPAVYLAALLTAALDFGGESLIEHSIVLSKGALIGMIINIAIALIAGKLLLKQGWKKGLTSSMMCWVVFSATVVLLTSQF
ncbi:DUF3147 family protein [Bacillus sp. JJ722]|uniref:DUF3147 family protein n=1 Tax=Bacillus sp. JJ722 TaxID=3122973 RepID=UPI002FFFA900